MPIADSLLQILACPKTKQPLVPLEQEKVEQLNQKIRSGAVVTVSGSKVEEVVEGALHCEASELLYLVRDAIPILLAEEAVAAGVLD